MAGKRAEAEKPEATQSTLAKAKRDAYNKKNEVENEQYYKKSKDIHGAIKTKVIERVKYKNGVVKERIKGILKNGEVIYDNGIKDLKKARDSK